MENNNANPFVGADSRSARRRSRFLRFGCPRVRVGARETKKKVFRVCERQTDWICRRCTKRAKKLGRNFIMIEQNEKYIEFGKKRLEKVEFEKVKYGFYYNDFK